MPTLAELSARICDAERRVAEREATGYDTPEAAYVALAHARSEWGHAAASTPDQAAQHCGIVTRDLDVFDALLHAQHLDDVGPADLELGGEA